jgi:hypothetical protein
MRERERERERGKAGGRRRHEGEYPAGASRGERSSDVVSSMGCCRLRQGRK